jgi:hypothetical protein
MHQALQVIPYTFDTLNGMNSSGQQNLMHLRSTVVPLEGHEHEIYLVVGSINRGRTNG